MAVPSQHRGPRARPHMAGVTWGPCLRYERSRDGRRRPPASRGLRAVTGGRVRGHGRRAGDVRGDTRRLENPAQLRTGGYRSERATAQRGASATHGSVSGPGGHRRLKFL